MFFENNNGASSIDAFFDAELRLPTMPCRALFLRVQQAFQAAVLWFAMANSIEPLERNCNTLLCDTRTSMATLTRWIMKVGNLSFICASKGSETWVDLSTNSFPGL